MTQTCEIDYLMVSENAIRIQEERKRGGEEGERGEKQEQEEEGTQLEISTGRLKSLKYPQVG